jgi:hypothetical protein
MMDKCACRKHTAVQKAFYMEGTIPYNFSFVNSDLLLYKNITFSHEITVIDAYSSVSVAFYLFFLSAGIHTPP